MVASDGGIFSFGEAPFLGSMGNVVLNQTGGGDGGHAPGNGYWMVASDGGIFSFGDAQFYGSMGGVISTSRWWGWPPPPRASGYWTVASDGGIFSFGDAQFYGSMGAVVLNQPMVGMAATPSGHGYWTVASDGGIFSFGTPSSTARWAVSPSTARSSAWRPPPRAGVLVRGPGRGHLLLRQRHLLRISGMSREHAGRTHLCRQGAL